MLYIRSLFYFFAAHFKMLLHTVIITTAIHSLCAAAAVPSTHTLHEKREVTPSRWVKRGKIHASTTLPVRIGLAQTNLDRGFDYLLDV